jgi:hypothetical protein
VHEKWQNISHYQSGPSILALDEEIDFLGGGGNLIDGLWELQTELALRTNTTAFEIFCTGVKPLPRNYAAVLM